ncbi:MAG: GumC family protein [Bernardetiaceae bacterium]
MNNLSQPVIDAKQTDRESQLDVVDLQKLLVKLLQYWWLFVISIFVALALAFIFNRYTTPIYSIKATIMLEGENEKSDVTNLLYESSFLKGKSNFKDEARVITSFPIVKRAVIDQNMQVTYYSQGRVSRSQLYPGEVPFVVDSEAARDSVLRYSGRPPAFFIQLLNEQEFLLTDTSKSIEKGQKYKYGQRITLKEPHFSIRLRPQNFSEDDSSEDDLYIIVFNNIDELSRSYSSNLKLFNEERSSVGDISINTSVPNIGIDFLEALIQSYTNAKLEDKQRSAKQTVEFIENQLQQITDTLQSVESRLEGVKRDFNLLESNNPAAEFNFQMFKELDTRKAELSIQRKYYEYLENYLTNADSYADMTSPSAVGINDPTLNSLVGALIEAQIKQNTIYLGIEAPDNPNVRRNRMEIQRLKEALQGTIKSLKETNEIGIQEVEKRLETVNVKISTLPAAERKFINVKRLYDINEQIYLLLLQKRLEARISEASATPGVKVIDPPFLENNGTPIKPRPRINYIIALALGLVFPALFVLVRSSLNNRISDADELSGMIAAPILGVVQHAPRFKNRKEGLVIVQKPKSALAEAFRGIRSSLAFMLSKSEINQEGQVILITSSISGEGKSFCSANISLAFAAAQKKTIQIVADMRKPQLYLDTIQEAGAEKGLSSYLIGKCTLEEVIQPTEKSFLDIINCGPLPPNPAELLMSARMNELLQILRQRYDYVIVDTAPVGLVSDALGVTDWVDTNIFIVRQKYTPKERLLYLNRLHQEKKITNVGLILNDVKREAMGGYGGYGGYGESSGYYEEDEGSKPWFRRLFSR